MQLSFLKAIFFLNFCFLFTNINLLYDFYSSQYLAGAIILSFFIFITKIKNIKINRSFLIFVLLTGLSLVFNEIPEILNSNIKWLLWIIVAVFMGPLIFSQNLVKFRIEIINLFLNFCIFISVLSFLWYVFNLPNLGRGTFTGITKHSMILAPLCSIAFIKLLVDIQHKRNKYLLRIALMLIALITVLLSASRTSILAILLIITLSFFIFSTKKYQNYIKILFIASTLLVIHNSYNFFEINILSAVAEKGVLNSRDNLWSIRAAEFYDSPILGIGFLNSHDPRVLFDYFNFEPGSSFMLILSNLGIIGFLSFLYFMSAVMLKDTNVKNYSRYKLTLFYIIIFFLVSFISEGYIFSISSGISLIFWLTLGSFQDLSFKVKQNYGNKA